MIDVRPVATRADLRAFIDVPYQKYRGHPHWVPPLRFTEWRRFNRSANPFFEHAAAEFLVAFEQGRPCGRIAAIDDALHNQTHGDNLAAFGLFEADSEAAALALLDAAETWGRSRGRARMRGPLSFSLNETAGLLVDGFDSPPAILMPYNPPEYADYLAGAGYEKVKDLYAWSLDLSRPFDPAMTALAERVRARYAVRIASPTKRTLLEEIPRFLEIYAKAWAGNWGFVPPSPAESRQFASDLKWIADPSFVLYAEVQGVKAACGVGIPDLNQLLAGTSGRLTPRLLLRLITGRRRIDRGRLLLVGVLPAYRKLGLYPLLLAELAERGARQGIRTAECSWVLEDNTDINQVAMRLGGRRSKIYRLYQKELR